MTHRSRATALWLGTLVLLLAAGPTFAQVPQATTFTGQLVDDLGNPLAGPVDLNLSVFDVATGGTALYAEEHVGTPLDVAGSFSVQLGAGKVLDGAFDAALFAGIDRWIEVEVDSEVLSPRQVVAAVPWALIAQQAHSIVPDPNAPRFEDCGDGTVSDRLTGLLWEKKTGTFGVPVSCQTASCTNPHDVNNVYRWSNSGQGPDGKAYTDFLARLNGGFVIEFDDDVSCFADRCDWRLPTLSELDSIHEPTNIPQVASALLLPVASEYWSTLTYAGDPSIAWYIPFDDTDRSFDFKTSEKFVRAVRTGSCH